MTEMSKWIENKWKKSKLDLSETKKYKGGTKEKIIEQEAGKPEMEWDINSRDQKAKRNLMF